MKAPSDRLFTAWILVGLIGLLLSLEACGGGDDKKGTARPTAPGQEASISGTIDLDRSLKERVAKEPLLMVLASKSPDPSQPAIIVKRVPGVVFPYRYKLTAEDITLVGSSLEGKVYVTARIDPAGMVGPARPGTLEGTHAHNPVVVGATNVDIVIGSTVAEASSPRAVSPGSTVPRIGLLWSGQTPFDTGSVPEALRQRFRELGYAEGQIVFEPRYAESRHERLPELAAELVRLKVDVILAAGDSAAVHAALNATKTIPIVMMAFADTAQLGFVASLARPGGNITGLSFPFAGLVEKQMEVLHASVPGISRIAVLWNPDNAGHTPALKNLQLGAQALGVQLQLLKVRGPGDFEAVFSAMKRERASAVIVFWDPMLYAHSGRLIRRAMSDRLPAISTFREFVAAGGLMAYGPNLADLFQGAAAYVDRILKGARPAELPVEEPTRFELVINLKTAKALGVTIPRSVLLQADQIVE